MSPNPVRSLADYAIDCFERAAEASMFAMLSPTDHERQAHLDRVVFYGKRAEQAAALAYRAAAGTVH